MVSTKHMLLDIQTGFFYAMKLKEDGACEAVSSYNTIVKTLSGDRTVQQYGPSFTEDDAPVMPFGKTTFAIDMKKDGTRGDLFTIVWPKQEDAAAGVKPQVTRKPLPANLVDAGIAAAPKGAPASKGTAVDDEKALAEAMKNIDKMIGLKGAKQEIKQNIAIARFNQAKKELGLSTAPISRHMVFTGNPGTGKTTFAREVAAVYHALGLIEKPLVVEVKRQDLVAGYVGQTAIKTKEQIDKAKGGILFIDEFYSLSRGGSGDSKDFGAEAIDTLVAEMENMRDNLIVIVAGYKEPTKRAIDANEGLKSRFSTYIDFDDYSGAELNDIMNVMLKDRGYVITDDARQHAMKLLDDEQKRAKKDFGNGRTVRNLVEKAEKELAMRLESENLLGKQHGLSTDDLKKAFTTLTLADLQKVSLQGLNPKKTGASFGAAPPQKAFNDNAQNINIPPVPQPETVSAKPKIKPSM